MAAIVVSSITNNFLPLPKSDPMRISMAVWPTGGIAEDSRKARAILLGEPDFIVYGTTDTNTADSVAIGLAAQGVTFPDATQRIIRVEASIADNDGQGLVRGVAVVDGGDTPIVVSDFVSADPVTGGLGAVPTLVITSGEAAVNLDAVGTLDVDYRWVIKVWVGDAIPLAYIATT